MASVLNNNERLPVSGYPVPAPQVLEKLPVDIIEEIIEILPSADVNKLGLSTDNDAVDMLMVAATNNKSQELKRLLQRNKPIQQDLGEVLIVAATQPKAAKIINILLDAGAPINYKNGAALCSAVMAAEADNVRVLIERGSQVTPQLVAEAAKKDEGLVKILKAQLPQGGAPIAPLTPEQQLVAVPQQQVVEVVPQQQLVQAVPEQQLVEVVPQQQLEVVQVPQPQPLQSKLSAAAGVIARHVKRFAQQVDPSAVYQAIAQNPEIVSKIKTGQINTADLGRVLQTYAEHAAEEKQSKQWAQQGLQLAQRGTQFIQGAKTLQATVQAADPARIAALPVPPTPTSVQPTEIQLPPPPSSIEHLGLMPPKALFESFSDQVQVAFKDLQRYPDKDIRLLAKQMKIIDCDSKSHDILCKEIAQKLIYIHSDKIPETDTAKCERYTKTFTSEKLDKIRKKIYKEFSQFKNSVTEMTSEELHDFLKRYDELCFDGDIFEYIKNAGFSLKFKTSGEPTFTTEGICTFTVCDYTITIPTATFKNVKAMTNVAGHPCKDQLECLQRVIEHEMVHLIIFMFCQDTFVTDQHGPLFMNMVRDLFGHTDHRHYIF